MAVAKVAEVESLREEVFAGRFFGSAGDVSGSSSLLAQFVASTELSCTLRLWLGPQLAQQLALSDNPRAGLRALLDRDIAALDLRISEQLDSILQHPRLTRLEGSWLGLHLMLSRAPAAGAGRIQIRLLQARWAEICRDQERVLEFDQSHLFRKIYDDRFDMAGGQPFGLVICDYEVRHRSSPAYPTDDVTTLQRLAGVAAAAFAPMILTASAELLGQESFHDLSADFSPKSAMRSTDHQRWREARILEDMRFIAVALPRVLGRCSWQDDGSRVDFFRYRACPPTAEGRVWVSPVYGFGMVAIRAFERYGWPGELRGANISEIVGGGVLENLPFECFSSDLPGQPPPRAPLEVAFTDDQEREFAEVGLVPLAALDGLPEACFAALPTLHVPPTTSSSVAQANQRISTQFNTVLCVSRFAHCVKSLGRKWIGSSVDPSEVEQRLRQWLGKFVSGGGLLNPTTTAKHPLADAQVEVRERRGQPGVYDCTVHLMPHHQVDDVGASFRLVTEFATQNFAR